MRKDNGVPFAGLTLQISADRHCCHEIKRNVKVLRHADGTLLLLTGNDPHQSRAIASRMGKGEQRRIRSRRAALADIAVEAGF